jgi:thiamine-monophosphate kinase
VRTHPPAALGWKALAVNLSDVAAMGSTPEAFTLSMALPADLDPAWLDAFAEGLGDCARDRARLAGGDTVRSPGPLLFGDGWGTAPTANA